jgi:hypothetical protein
MNEPIGAVVSIASVSETKFDAAHEAP